MAYKDKEKAREHQKIYDQLHRKDITDYKREWRFRHAVSGLCKECNNPVLEGSVLCPLHWSKERIRGRYRYNDNMQYRQMQSKNSQKRKSKLKEENKCISCGMPLDEESRVGYACLTCYSKSKGFI